MEKPAYYLAHDPLGNCEWQITEFDETVLSKAEESGIIFIAVDSAGNRERVSAADIKKPESSEGGLVLVQPVYVDDRMKAVIDVFDALSAGVPAVASNAEVKAASRSGGIMSFAEALEALRALVYGTESEGDER